MTLRSPIFSALADIYAESRVGRTGLGMRDVQPTFAELCVRAGMVEGEAYELAVAELVSVDGRLLKLEWDHPRARTTIHKIRLSPKKEAEFHAAIGRESPTALRARWSKLFRQMAEWPVDKEHRESWTQWCGDRAERVVHWESMTPFRMRKLRDGMLLLDTTARLLGWRGENLIRWVSSHLCGDSKRLERRQSPLELLLAEATGGRVANFYQHGILPMPREARVSGPLRLRIGGQILDCAAQEVATLSIADLERAELVECRAVRCLTVENKTVFLDLARKRSGELIVWTSFPNAATLALLMLLPRSLEFHHFGDTDPAGFQILGDLRRRSGLPFEPFRMHHREKSDTRPLTDSEIKLLTHLHEQSELAPVRQEIDALLKTRTIGSFEQEEHQPAPLDRWPFYPA